MITGVWHFSFTVSDLERSLVHTQRQANHYTRQLVGYPDTDLKVAMLRIPGTDPRPSGHFLELVEYVTPRGQRVDTATKNPGSAHLALAVDDIHAEYRRLKACVVRFRSEPVLITDGRNRGGYTVYLEEPDGITIELVQPPKHM